MEILLATGNAGKTIEMKRLLADLPIRLHDLTEFPNIVEPEESGATFAENAVLKAVFYARQTNLRSLADDSGLEVEALGSAPGIFSARYAGAAASDAENIEKLLGELDKRPNASRRARFVCTMAICAADGAVEHVAEAACAGTIAPSRAGTSGFGYDPIFIPDGFTETFGELLPEVKQKISHRARAVRKIIEHLRTFPVIELDRRIPHL